MYLVTFEKAVTVTKLHGIKVTTPTLAVKYLQRFIVYKRSMEIQRLDKCYDNH